MTRIRTPVQRLTVRLTGSIAIRHHKLTQKKSSHPVDDSSNDKVITSIKPNIVLVFKRVSSVPHQRTILVDR